MPHAFAVLMSHCQEKYKDQEKEEEKEGKAVGRRGEVWWRSFLSYHFCQSLHSNPTV